MKITVRASCRKDAKILVLADPELSKVLDPQSSDYDFDTDTEIFNRFLHVTAGSSGSRFNPDIDFDDRELLGTRLFQIDCRGTLLQESKKDYQLNHDELISTSFIYTDHKTKIRFPDKIFLSKISLKPYMIGGATDWLEEYVLHKRIVEIFEKARLTGFSTGLIYNSKEGRYHEDYFLLHTTSILPKAEVDITTVIRDEPEGVFYRELGCLTYSSPSIHFEDFNRTAENWSSNYCPIWVVSSATKSCYEENKLRGWRFRPVLEKDSDLHAAYIRKWETLLQAIKANPHNNFY